jgi:hypothetical protein
MLPDLIFIRVKFSANPRIHGLMKLAQLKQPDPLNLWEVAYLSMQDEGRGRRLRSNFLVPTSTVFCAAQKPVSLDTVLTSDASQSGFGDVV